MDREIAQLEKLVNEGDIKLSAEDMEKLHKDGKITLPDGSVLYFVGKPANEPKELSPFEKRLAKLAAAEKERREALKEMFKKIITKVIND